MAGLQDAGLLDLDLDLDLAVAGRLGWAWLLTGPFYTFDLSTAVPDSTFFLMCVFFLNPHRWLWLAGF